MLTIELTTAGRRRPLLPSWEIPPVPPRDERGEPLTLRRLITRVVLNEVREFTARQDRRRFVHVLSERELTEGLTRGRVDSGGQTRTTVASPDAAVATALQAFEDGLYIVLIDDREHRDLDEQVAVAQHSRVTFLRLVMLTGA